MNWTVPRAWKPSEPPGSKLNPLLHRPTADRQIVASGFRIKLESNRIRERVGVAGQAGSDAWFEIGQKKQKKK